MKNRKIILLLIIIFGFYTIYRCTQIYKMKNEIKQISQQIDNINKNIQSIKQLRSDLAYIDTIGFAEKIIEIAKLTKIEKINITTKTKTTGIKKSFAEKNNVIIEVDDDYRKIAEFIREVENLKYFFNINKLELLPSENDVRAIITIEIFLKG